MTASMNYVQDAFRKLSVNSNSLITVKQEQKEAVNSLINGKMFTPSCRLVLERVYFSTVLYGRGADKIVWRAHRSWKLPSTSNRAANICWFVVTA